ncbi:hypothetical protein [Campylobacter gastrosuis]|uniref:Uncharacterized protein n=1 Tax=Campylobacter gastrosuis TaxID=2974576 RepID=A0ABT7HRK3_9BACT|nr:hypothetical protein [Campylobacter gastrosuis]MDL0089547.1 hypothetical protein [Campylobacter gastrosuis]
MKKLLLFVLVLAINLNAFQTENEHPPLSESTKKAIAIYKQNPNETNKNALLNTLNKSYESVILRKEQKLNSYIAQRDKTIQKWLNSVKFGKDLPFMKLDNSNNKEREKIKNAISQYQKNPKNEAILKEALSDYYDAFLNEQQIHIKQTKELKDERIKQSLEYFTSKNFNPKRQILGQNSTSLNDALAEIIASFICSGAEILPVNPELRVAERSFNANINALKKTYDENRTNKEALKNELEKAYKKLYSYRLNAISNAINRGEAGANLLFNKMQNSEFLNENFAELKSQRNLYGRIDRLICFGTNTANSDFHPRFKELSNELAKNFTKTNFTRLYQKVLLEQNAHINAINLNELVQKNLDELTK